MKNKPILLYDGTLLANKYSHKNSDRTGVYFVAYNLLLQLMHQRQFEVQVYTQWQDTKVAQALREDGFGQVRVLTDKNLDDCGASVYLSPFAPAPARIAADKSIKKYMILHDLTPLALGDIERPNQDWFKALEHGLNERDYYFADSAYTKQDFLRFYPSLNPEHIRVAYLAAADRFGIERIVEIGCGDFNVMGQVLGYLWAKGYPCDYAGIDVVPDLVSYNESVFSRPGVHFSCADASQPETELPDGDLLIIRQVLQHLPNEDIAQILEKAKKYHYLLITEHIYEGDDVQYNIDQPVNFDTRLPKHSGVYLEQSPYNMQNIVHLLRVPQVGGMIRTSLVIQSSGE